MYTRRKQNLTEEDIRKLLAATPCDESEGEDIYSDEDTEYILPNNSNFSNDDFDVDNANPLPLGK